MTQAVKPMLSTWAANPTVKWSAGGEKGSLWIECVSFHPKSADGKKVMVYLDVEAVTALLLVLRERAIEARR